ncbi:Hypothetical predicted protein [Marmota monax]|uniref:Uncharacterized protein n=1 Tax=Marmota monax TaxID=9995 RepID=A0A5E4BL69_MARMO|nr:hypothetical protein GHT09_016343 [Marmota monax]VTJ70444.1 Hypothetical predicted protein [Marmota monax]
MSSQEGLRTAAEAHSPRGVQSKGVLGQATPAHLVGPSQGSALSRAHLGVQLGQWAKPRPLAGPTESSPLPQACLSVGSKHKTGSQGPGQPGCAAPQPEPPDQPR